MGSADVARTSRSGPVLVDRAVHGVQHLRVLGHTEVVVAAPDGHLPPGAVGKAAQCRRIGPRTPVDVHELPVLSARLQVTQFGRQELLVHAVALPYDWAALVVRPRSAREVHRVDRGAIQYTRCMLHPSGAYDELRAGGE